MKIWTRTTTYVYSFIWKTKSTIAQFPFMTVVGRFLDQIRMENKK